MNHAFKTRLFVATALSAAAISGAAFAQAAQNPQQLGEVVVTASRRSDTVHNIPMSIQAVTPQQVENQGLKTAQDLARVVPALHIGSSNSTIGNVDVAIRGVRAASGASTTGIYIDDVSITQRNTNNPLPGGTVLPQLFDLERVEVLYGPQGTLYGGSSEGGTLRYITNQPSLTKMSAKIRLEGTTTDGGDPGFDFGAMVGGPIIQDKLGFRLSADYRKDGGYIDHVSLFSGKVLPNGQNTNSTESDTIHAAFTWKPIDQLSINFSYLYSKIQYDDSDSYWENFPAFTGLINAGAPTGPTFVQYGPYNVFGAYKTGLNTNVGPGFYQSDAQLQPLNNPNSHEMRMPTLSIDYALGPLKFKSITGYVETRNQAALQFPYADIESQTPARSPLLANLPVYNSEFDQFAKNTTTSQEFRLAYNEPDSKITFVVGAFYSDAKLIGTSTITANLGDALVAAIGAPPSAFPGFNGQILNFPQKISEEQLAGFGEFTYSVTPKFKVTAGVRVTRDQVKVQAFQGGALFNPNNPTALLTSADTNTTETPVTPKFGLQYIVDSNVNLYANAAKGYRAGGANNDLRQSSCVSSLIQNFGSAAAQPLQYGSDSLWNYEAGTKLRTWGGKATINASVFYIDWKNPQTYYFLPCAQPIAINANADIISQGVQLETSARLFDGFTGTFNLGYTDAHYNGVVNTGPGTPAIFNDGDPVPYTPKWSISVAGQYNFKAYDYDAFIRADYQYQSSLRISSGPGTANYSPDNFGLPATNYFSARTGVTINSVDYALFVNNLTNSKDLTNRAGLSPGAVGRTGCLDTACSTSLGFHPGAALSTFRPRTIGISVSMKY